MANGFGLRAMVLCLCLINGVSARRLRRPHNLSPQPNGERLMITPFIRSGKVDMAKELARVRGLPGVSNDNEVESYSGYLTVNSEYNSNMFFWFVPAIENRAEAPVMLWLNGGPGTTSMVGFFNEHGPYYLKEDDGPFRRNLTWTKSHSIIYMDSPVGAGFSFTDSDMGYSVNTEEVTDNLYEALTQFFTIFHEYHTKEFYVAGQSYAGKYAPSLAHKIHVRNHLSPPVMINLRGVSVGSGFFDPITQINYADFYYGIGLIDDKEFGYFQQQQDLTRELIEKKNWSQAFIVLESLIVGYPTPWGISYFENITGLTYLLNIIQDEEPKENHCFVKYLNRDAVRRALHVGDQKFTKFNPKIYNSMSNDIYQSIKPLFLDLLNNGYKMLVYTAQFDGIVPHVTVNSFVNSLKWKKSDEYQKAKREMWRSRSDDSLAGYKKRTGNLYFVMIRDSGHLAAQDQPEWTYELITDFTRGNV